MNCIVLAIAIQWRHMLRGVVNPFHLAHFVTNMYHFTVIPWSTCTVDATNNIMSRYLATDQTLGCRLSLTPTRPPAPQLVSNVPVDGSKHTLRRHLNRLHLLQPIGGVLAIIRIERWHHHCWQVSFTAMNPEGIWHYSCATTSHLSFFYQACGGEKIGIKVVFTMAKCARPLWMTSTRGRSLSGSLPSDDTGKAYVLEGDDGPAIKAYMYFLFLVFVPFLWRDSHRCINPWVTPI